MHQPLSEAEVLPELLPIHIRAVKMMSYSAKPRPIPSCPMEAFPLLASCQLLLSIQIRHLHMLSLFPHTRVSPAYKSHVAYVVEVGTY